jgi:surfeit locus 1 family protein
LKQIFLYRFKFRLIPALAVLALLALFVHLGLWQAGKAERGAAQKALYETRGKQPPLRMGANLVAAEDMVYAQVAVRGEYEAAHQFYIDNQLENGRPGVHVITPLRIAGGDTRVLVNRGWAAWADRRMPPHAKIPGGMVEISGIAVMPIKQKYLLMPDRRENWRELWSSLDMQRYIEETHYQVQPVILHLTSPARDEGLVRKWPQPEDKILMHKGYAMQWFGMAVALLGFYFISGFRKRRDHDESKA